LDQAAKIDNLRKKFTKYKLEMNMSKLKITLPLLPLLTIISMLNGSYNSDKLKELRISEKELEKHLVFDTAGYLDLKKRKLKKLTKDAKKLPLDLLEKFDKPYPISIKQLYPDKVLLAASDDHSKFIMRGNNNEEEKIAYIYNKKSCLKTVKFPGMIFKACFSPSAKTFAMTSFDNASIHKMDDPDYIFEINKAAMPFIFYGEDYLLATIGDKIEKIDLKTKKRITICDITPFINTSLFLELDKLFFVDCCYKLNILDLNNTTIIKKIDMAGSLTSVSKTGLLAHLAKDFKTMIVQSILDQKNPVNIKLFGQSDIDSLAFSPCEKYLACGTTKEDSQIHIWDWQKQQKIAQFDFFPKSPLCKVLWNPHGRSIIAVDGFGHCLKIELSHLKDLLETKNDKTKN